MYPLTVISSNKYIVSARSMHITHVILPCLVWFPILILFEVYQLDLIVADWIYNLEGHTWSLKDSFILENLLHRGGRTAVGILFLMILASAIYDHTFKSLQYAKPKYVLLGSIIFSVSVVSIAKQLTHIGCLWDYQRYGGVDIYTAIFSRLPLGHSERACFPAGHASGGYTWVALFYYFVITKPQYRWYGLAFGLFIGLTFDLAQQFRGAHFASHGLWTLGIAWLMSSCIFLVAFRES